LRGKDKMGIMRGSLRNCPQALAPEVRFRPLAERLLHPVSHAPAGPLGQPRGAVATRAMGGQS